MSYNKNNVWIDSRDGFIRMNQTGFLSSHIRPTYKILAEGDSWFHIGGSTGIGKARNLLDGLSFNQHHTVLCNMALFGDTIATMSDDVMDGNLGYMLKNYDWDGLLLSGGGNDLIDALLKSDGYTYQGKTLGIIKENQNGSHFQDYINQADLNLFNDAVLNYYQKIIDYKSTTRNANKPIFLHTYDYPVPRNAPARVLFFKAGPWIYRAFKEMNVPEQHWEKITVELFNQLELTLMSLDGSNHVHVIKTFGTLNRADPSAKKSSNDWLNEIHPNKRGIRKLSKKFNETLKQFYL